MNPVAALVEMVTASRSGRPAEVDRAVDALDLIQGRACLLLAVGMVNGLIETLDAAGVKPAAEAIAELGLEAQRDDAQLREEYAAYRARVEAPVVRCRECGHGRTEHSLELSFCRHVDGLAECTCRGWIGEHITKGDT